MKKTLKILLISVLCIISVLPINTFAVNEANQVEVYNIDLTENEIHRILALNPQTNINTRASDLILYYNVAIEKSGSLLKMVAKIVCDSDVVKCGFKKIVFQRRANSSSSWSAYVTIEDIYNESTSNVETRAFTAPTGYQYRAVCTFYAKKNILITQTIQLNSNIVTF